MTAAPSSPHKLSAVPWLTFGGGRDRLSAGHRPGWLSQCGRDGPYILVDRGFPPADPLPLVAAPAEGTIKFPAAGPRLGPGAPPRIPTESHIPLPNLLTHQTVRYS